MAEQRPSLFGQGEVTSIRISLHLLRRLRSATGALALIALAATLAGGFSQSWTLTIISGVALAGLVLLAAVLDSSFFDSFERAKEDAPTFLADELLEAVEVFESDLSWSQVDVLLEGLLVPHNIRMRTRERIQPRTRSLFRQIRLDLDLPSSKRPLFVPVCTYRKGVLQDFREVTSAGEPVRVLTYFESSALFAAVIRHCMAAAGNHKTDGVSIYEKYLDDVEPSVLAVLTKRSGSTQDVQDTQPGSEVKQGQSGQTAATDATFKQLKHLAKRAEVRSMVYWARAVADRLEEHYAIIACIEQGGHTVVDIADYVVPTSRSTPSRESAKNAGWPTRAYLWTRSMLRSALGSIPARFTVDADLALQSRSYHLEFEGPEGMFLVRQGLVQLGRDEVRGLGAYDRWRGRYGQRYAHFYLRDGYRLEEPPNVRFSFMERPPGSIAWAVIGALACSALYALAQASPLNAEDARIGMAGLFIALPSAVATWAGFASSGRFFGVLSTARLILYATIALGLLGAFATIGQHHRAIWVGCAVSLGVSATGLYWWFGHTRIHARFARKDSA